MALIKREILTSRKVLYMSFVRVISSRFAKYGFLCLKCQLTHSLLEILPKNAF